MNISSFLICSLNCVGFNIFHSLKKRLEVVPLTNVEIANDGTCDKEVRSDIR